MSNLFECINRFGMPNMSKRKKTYSHLENIENHDDFLNRITKTLYYAKLPTKNCLSLPMTELVVELFTEVKKDHTLERLEIEEASRISRNVCVSPCSMVLALLYIERLKDCNPEYLKRVANSELFLVTLLVASKFLHDDGEEDEVLNVDWAYSGNMSISEINRLEQEFLQAINWSLFIKTEDFWKKLLQLEKELAYKEAQKRGWFSYTEVNCLLDSAHLMSMISYVLNVYSVCIAAYTAGLVTLVGSALIASYIPGTALTSDQEIIKTDFLSTDKNITNDNYLMFNVEICKGCQMLNDINVNFTQINQHAEWWLNSMLTWLPEYSGLCKINDIFKSRASSMITRAEFDDSFISEKKLAIRINYGENVEFSLPFLFYDWRYYLSTISKITVTQ